MLCWCGHLVLSFESLRMLLFKLFLQTDQGHLRSINNVVMMWLAVCVVRLQDYRPCYLEQFPRVGWQGPRISERVQDS